jgi:hypothetical protein
MGTDKIILRFAYHKSFRVNFPSRYEWQYIFNPAHKGGWSGIQTGPRPARLYNRVLKRDIASLLAST